MRKIDTEHVMTLGDLSEIVVPATGTWTLIGRDVREKFKPEYDMTLGELLGVIGLRYARLKGERPKIEVPAMPDEEFEGGSFPFWGDHVFVERIEIDEKARTVTLGIGS